MCAIIYKRCSTCRSARKKDNQFFYSYSHLTEHKPLRHVSGALVRRARTRGIRPRILLEYNNTFFSK